MGELVMISPDQWLRRVVPRDKSPIQRRSWLRALQGGVLSLGAPLGWMIIQAMFFDDAWAHLVENPYLYLYMLVGTGLVFTVFGFYVGIQEGRSAWEALRDPLTGLYNVRYFQSRLADEAALVSRKQVPVALVMLDLDHFKHVNDRFGHPIGDKLLMAVAGLLSNVVRKGETAARVGGEEFALILPGCDAAHGMQVAERILARVREIGVALDNGEMLHITASLGVVTLDEAHADWRDAYARADQALYQAKQHGRDRVVLADAPSRK
jgi:diguanylate cyclase (GGDEF)-like protein